MILASLAVLFVSGVIHLFDLRFRKGDVYPPYSSLRADPLGTKVMYDALDELDHIKAVRNYLPINRLDRLSGTTALFLGISEYTLMNMDEQSAESLEGFVQKGNRLFISLSHDKDIISLIEEMADMEEIKDEKDEENTGEEENDEGCDEINKAPYEPKTVSLAQRWGVDIDHDTSSGDDDFFYACPSESSEIVTWNTSAFFTITDNAWHSLYTCKDNPVIIERPFGDGSILISTDTFFLSNEAMKDERHSALLTYIIGPNHKVIFEETHFGIVKRLGIASLIIKYDLIWFVFAMGVLAVLFIWKNSSSLVPGAFDMPEDASSNGKDFTTGLINLIQRNIPSKDIIDTCLDEWEKAFGRTNKDALSRLKEARSVVLRQDKTKKSEAEIVKRYKTITRILAGRPNE